MKTPADLLMAWAISLVAEDGIAALNFGTIRLGATSLDYADGTIAGRCQDGTVFMYKADALIGVEKVNRRPPPVLGA